MALLSTTNIQILINRTSSVPPHSWILRILILICINRADPDDIFPRAFNNHSRNHRINNPSGVDIWKIYIGISDTLQRRFRLIIIDSCNEFHRAKIGGEIRPRGITQFIYPFIIDLIKTANSTLSFDICCPIWIDPSRISWKLLMKNIQESLKEYKILFFFCNKIRKSFLNT